MDITTRFLVIDPTIMGILLTAFAVMLLVWLFKFLWSFIVGG